MDAWQAVAVALAVGLLVGAGRGRDGGVLNGRTFALAGLAGAGAALVHPIALGLTAAGAALIVAGLYVNAATKDPAGGLALVGTVLLGGLAVSRPPLAVGGGVVVALMLLTAQRLPAVIRDRLPDLELFNALKFAVVAVLGWPLLPAANLGPGGVLDLRRVWTFVVVVAALGWLGQVAVRLADPRRGLPAVGLAGGFVASAATTGSLARTSRDPSLFRPAMAGALLATAASLVPLVLVTAVADARVAGRLAPALGLGALVLVGEASWLLRPPGTPWRWVLTRPAGPPRTEPGSGIGTVIRIDFGQGKPDFGQDEPDFAQGEPDFGQGEPDEPTQELPPVPVTVHKGRRPFDLMPALLLAVLLAGFLLVAALADQAFGAGAAVVAVAVAGLVDASVGGVTAANLAAHTTLTVPAAVLATVAALTASTVVKLALAHAAGGRRASTALAIFFAGPAVVIAVSLVVTLAVA